MTDVSNGNNGNDDDIVGILKRALAEDLGAIGDITSQAIFSEAEIGEALIRSKQAGVLSGAALIAPLFEQADAYQTDLHPHARPAQPPKVRVFCRDGDALAPGTAICSIDGPVRTILSGERTILNLLQRLSGIATATAEMVEALKGSDTRVLDTRKTAPGLRALEKAAVRHGGGANHRAGLYDMVLIKDTHIKHAGGVRAALTKALRWRDGRDAPLIEIEVQSMEEFVEALPLKPDRIMLDNMSPEEIETCVEERDMSGLKIELEASGGITLFTLPAIAAAGVDFVSSGAITHSAPALDINLIMV